MAAQIIIFYAIICSKGVSYTQGFRHPNEINGNLN